jgi:3-methyladenine DNA glycosylase AlkD
MNDILTEIRAELRRESDDRTRESAHRFFREPVKLYGVKTAVVTKIADRYFRELRDRDKAAVFDLCEELFSSGCLEELFIASRWSYKLHQQTEAEDFARFDRWVRTYITSWASCDMFCNHTVGAFIEKFPQYLDELKVWAQSDNRWVRRASAVSLIVPAKRGKFLAEAFAIADLLLNDKDDLVQKGYGWLLKEESRLHQREVFEYVLGNRGRMPRTALRYAIELMPPELKKRVMAK